MTSLLLRAGINHQRRHRWQAFLALLGISMGVAIVLAVDLANEAARASFELSAAQLRGAATHRVTGPGGQVPDSAYRALFTTPGTPPLAPVIRATAILPRSGQRVQLLGLDILAEGPFRLQWSTALPTADLGSWLSRPDQLMLSTAAADALGVAQGKRIQVRTAGRTHQLEVAGVSPGTSSATRDLLIVDIATAQYLLGMHGHIGYIDVIASDREAEQLSTRLPAGLRLVDIDRQTGNTLGLSAAFQLNLTAMSLLALVVGLFLIYNAMSFSVVQRRPLFGRLRAVGVQPGEIRRMLLIEALALGALGSAVGLLLGIGIGQGLTRLVARSVSELYYRVSVDALHIDVLSVGKALALGLAGSMLASLLPAHQAASTPPVSTLSRSSLERHTLEWVPWLAAGGGLLVLAGPIIAFHAPGDLAAGLLGLFILIIGAVLMTPAFIPLFHLMLRRLPLRGTWRLAVRDLGRHVSRLGTATAALMIALSAAVSVSIMVGSMRDAVSDWLGSALNADLYVAAEDFGLGTTLPPGLAGRIERLPEVQGLSLYRRRLIDLGERPVALVAAHLAPASRRGFDFIRSERESAWRAFDRGAVLVSEPLANRLRIGAGDAIRLPFPDGSRRYAVAAVFRDFASEHGRVFMPRASYLRDWGDAELNTLALFSADHSPAELKHAVGSLTGAQGQLVLTEAGAIYRESMAVFERTFRVTEVLRALSLGVAFIGILSALMAIQLQRRKEFAVLRALGMTRAQLARLILAGSLLPGAIAALLALPTGILMAWVLTGAVQFRAFGWSMSLIVEPGAQMLNLGMGILAALLAAAWPAWTAARRHPAPWLRED